MITTNKIHFLSTGVLLASIMLAGSLQAEVTFTVSDKVPNGDNGSGTRTLSTSLGSVSADPALPTMTYTVTNLDFTSVGGTASETVAFDITFSHGGTGGTGVQFSSWGNISVTGGDDNVVDNAETVTATVGINTGSTTYAGDLLIGFTSFSTGDVSVDADEFWNVITRNGTELLQSPGNTTVTFAASPFVTLDPVSGNRRNGTFSAEGFDVQITATSTIPEPSAALLGGFVLMGLLIRRRSR